MRKTFYPLPDKAETQRGSKRENVLVVYESSRPLHLHCVVKQDRIFMHDITLWRVRVTTITLVT